jgi:choline dehydrogenase-like flavoprotein
VRRVIPDGSRRTVARIGAQTIDRKVNPVRPGHTFTVRAKHYVLAAGGIETIRLLLMSDELGNEHGHLGRNFMVHPLNEYAGRLQMTGRPREEYLNFYSGYPTLKRPAWPPAIFATFVPTDQTLRDDEIGNFRTMVDFWGGNINLNWEQLPNPQSRISRSDKRDLFGDPEVKLDWATLPVDKHTAARALAHTIAEVVKLGFASGGTSDPTITRAGDHHMGATKMSAESRHGYVNADCRAHEVGNLYIASSSVFATGGVSNPTLTIIALAARLGEHLARL